MDELKKLIPSEISNVLERTGIFSTKQILLLSTWEIMKITNLCINDIRLVKNIVAETTSPGSFSSDKLVTIEYESRKVTSGCHVIDKILLGGFRKGTLTEIYGESGSGKTQLALQAAAHNWATGCVYICTEDLFPVKRFEQIKQTIPGYETKSDYGKKIFIEHVSESNDLLSCVRIRLRKLLDEHKLTLIIIDSVAAPFRCDYDNYVLRAEDLRELAISLIKLAQEFNLACVCINQVTANFNSENVLPSLGLAWSNMISTRLWLNKTKEIVNMKNNNLNEQCFVRELFVIFAPDLPNSKVKIIITSLGIQKY